MGVYMKMIKVIIFSSMIFTFSASIVSLSLFCMRKKESPDQRLRSQLYRDTLIRSYGAEPIVFQSLDNTCLSGFVIKRPHAKRTILVCHGYHMNKERVRQFLDIIPDDNIVLFDFRAHGESEGSIITFGYYEQQDVLAAVHYIQHDSYLSQFPLCGVGVSMGAASLIRAAVHEQSAFKALILDSSFACLHQQLERSFSAKTGLKKEFFMPIMKMIYESFARFVIHEVRPVSSAHHITIPTLIIHSEHDDFIHVEDAYAIYKELAGYKELWLVPDMKHGNIRKQLQDAYKNRIQTFFSVVFS